mgnify:CR=1 FL=1
MILEPRAVKLTTRTGVEVHRLLPHAHLKRIGAWVFLDHFGPTSQQDAMVVAAHPHTGLQTATWLLQGEVEHSDSVGSRQMVEPGQFNLMTAGRGIAHSELGQVSDAMHAVQLWIALPESVRNMEPFFEHHANLPVAAGRGFVARVFAGEFHGAVSPARVFSPLIGAELELDTDGAFWLQLDAGFEYGIVPLTGSLWANGQHVEAGQLWYSAVGNAAIELRAGRPGTRALLIGGEPFREEIVMWWNFIGRSHQDIVEMREAWNRRDPRFGPEFPDEIGGWIPAPELPHVALKPR